MKIIRVIKAFSLSPHCVKPYGGWGGLYHAQPGELFKTFIKDMNPEVVEELSNAEIVILFNKNPKLTGIKWML